MNKENYKISNIGYDLGNNGKNYELKKIFVKLLYFNVWSIRFKKRLLEVILIKFIILTLKRV